MTVTYFWTRLTLWKQRAQLMKEVHQKFGHVTVAHLQYCFWTCFQEIPSYLFSHEWRFRFSNASQTLAL